MATGEAIEGSNHLMDFILDANTNPGIGESGRGGVYLHKRTYILDNAISRSANRSPMSSKPTETLNKFLAVVPYFPSTVARCSIKLSVPPSEVARLKSFTFFTTYACNSASD